MGAETKSPVAEYIEQARGMMAFNPALAPPMEQFWKAQDRILNDAEAVTKAWFERRHEAARSALDAVRTMNGNGADPAAAMQAMAEWQHGSFKRLAEDVQQWVELCATCAGRMNDAKVDAVKQGAEGVARRAK